MLAKLGILALPPMYRQLALMIAREQNNKVLAEKAAKQDEPATPGQEMVNGKTNEHAAGDAPD